MRKQYTYKRNQVRFNIPTINCHITFVFFPLLLHITITKFLSNLCINNESVVFVLNLFSVMKKTNKCLLLD